MTNEYFILALNVMRIAVAEKDMAMVTQLLEHAQKLVAVAEAAKLIQPVECGMFGHNKLTFHKYDQDCPYVKQFNDAFNALERE